MNKLLPRVSGVGAWGVRSDLNRPKKPSRQPSSSGVSAERRPPRQRLSSSPCIIALIFFLFAGNAVAGSKDLYLEALADFQRHAETIWHVPASGNAPANSGYWGDGASGGNGGIRGSCGVAVAHAALIRGYPAAPERTARLDKIRRALDYAANTHMSGTNQCVDGKQWGHGWQSALWAGSMGFACMLVEADLPQDTVVSVKRALADEAAYRAGIPPASGYDGDTKAEENGWNANVVALAAAWLSNDPQAASWLASAKQYLANTYTVADKSGDPLQSWLSTTTLHPDFSLENHGFYHPTYQMVAGMSMGDSLLMAQLCNPAAAADLAPFAEHNVLNVWSNLNHLVLDSGEFAYPSGLDWELHDFEQNSYITWLATHFTNSLAAWTDDKLARLVRYRQIVNGDGRFVGESMANGFFREAVEARRTAIAWLHLAGSDQTTVPMMPPPPALSHSAYVNIISHRGAFGFISLSFGDKIAAVIEPPALSVPTNAFMTTPKVPGILGLGLLGNPTSASLVRFETNANGFEAELILTHGLQGTTTVYVNSNGKAVAIVEVPHPAIPLTGEAGSFTVGIENDPLTGGSRLLEWMGGTSTFTNRGGAARNITNDWVCVAGRYGMAAGPAGYFRYQTASSYNRSGAAEDALQFFPQDQLGARYAVWFPGQGAARTAELAARIHWSISDNNAVLSFPGLEGDTQIIALLQPSQPPYTPYVLEFDRVEASSFQASYPVANVVDQSLSTFWVSSGSLQGQGPTPDHPAWLKFAFPRQVAISKFQIHPRTLNGGYGPKTLRMLLDGVTVYDGGMTATAALEVALNPPIYATNAELLITSSYDPMYPANSRNVQIMEMMFYERALPGTYGDWLVRRFSDQQLGDLAVGGVSGDPDRDGIPNLTEFAMGGDPFVPDGTAASLDNLTFATGSFSFRFNQRANLGEITRTFEVSTNLLTWTDINPIQVNVAGTGSVRTCEALFHHQPAASYFRLKFFPSNLSVQR